MEKLNVKCSSCNEGKVTFLVCNVIEEAEYEMGCDTCSNTFITDEDGFNEIMDIHEYNEQANDDIRLLNENGTWSFLVQFDTRQGFDVQEYTRKMTHIQSIEVDAGINQYYIFNGFFLNVYYDMNNGKINTHLYTPKEESKSLIADHFGMQV